MMKKLLYLGLLQSIALSGVFAQGPSATTVVGPIYENTGGLYTGSLVIQSQSRTNTGWVVVNTVRTVYVQNGVVSAFSLIPNDTSVPAGTSYLVTFANNAVGVPGGIWTCVIPTSVSPVAFSSVCSPNSTPPTVGNAFPVSQIIPSQNNGSILITQNGITSWSAGAAVTVVTYSATPTFVMGTDQNITLTGNVTSSTATNINIGSISRFNICQDSVGSRTFVFPTSFRGVGTIGSTLNKCSVQQFESFDGTTMEAISSMVVNQ